MCLGCPFLKRMKNNIVGGKVMILMIKAVIFDLDGVLVSTDEMHFKAWSRLAEELGITNFTKEDNIRQRGVSRMQSLEIVLEKSDKTYTDAEKEEFAARKNGYYCEMLEELTPNDVLPGALDFLKFLKANNIKTALGSASKNAPLILEKTALSEYLDAISCGLDVTKSKPDPEVFLVAAKKLGIAPEDCVVVEDAHAGIQAAKNGNMYAFAVGAAYGDELADFSAKTLASLECIIK